jgi:hypothetical protein
MEQYQDIIDEIVGLDMLQASKLVREKGLMFRIVKSNGKDLDAKTNLNFNRLNVSVENNEVIEVISVG